MKENQTFKSCSPPISSQATFGTSTVMPLVMLGRTLDLACFQSSIVTVTESLLDVNGILCNADMEASRHKASKSAPT